ncbi:MAG: hypothetical protein JSS83_10585 [Cyanobacteria bacterium SZAS LIN-3]|nr:hypothetical protein [Cyanobacteria bacterium SZAS LIN-3]
MKGRLLNLILTASIVAAALPASAQVLQGGVRLDGSMNRLSRPVLNGSAGTSTDMPPTAPPARLTGYANQGGAGQGLVGSGQFDASPGGDSLVSSADKNAFDIGTERGSKELTVAWDAWHQQLSKEIYARWQELAFDRGRATMRVTVTKDHHIFGQIVSNSGNPRFDGTLLEVIRSLDGNPGLSFPGGSQRQSVSFIADYIADTNVQGGYSWEKNDYEKVKQFY